METKRVDKLKLVIWGGQTELQEKLVKELSKAKIISQKVSTSNEWQTSLEKNQAQAGAIIITNDNINHALELVKNIRSKDSFVPLFVFAASKEEGHLITEAEETGFSDHFYFPIDIDLIATKLGRYFFQEDLQKFQLIQASVPLNKSDAKVNLKCQIISVDENGLTLKSSHMLTKGVEVNINQSDILHFLGQSELKVVIEKSWAEDDQTFCSYAEWKSSPEEMANSVRKWALEMKN